MDGTYLGHNEGVTSIFVQNLPRYLAGEPLTNVVDPARGYWCEGLTREAVGERGEPFALLATTFWLLGLGEGREVPPL